MTVTAKKRGFTLIELLIVLTIISILVGVVVLSVGNVFGTAKKRAYETVKHQVQTAVIAYSVRNLGDFPLTGNTTVIDGKTLGIIDACSLVIYYDIAGLFREIPDGFAATQGDDCCDSQTYNCSCDEEAHYIWAIDVNGNVYSSCVDTALNSGGCTNNSSNGFQDVWP